MNAEMVYMGVHQARIHPAWTQSAATRLAPSSIRARISSGRPGLFGSMATMSPTSSTRAARSSPIREVSSTSGRGPRYSSTARQLDSSTARTYIRILARHGGSPRRDAGDVTRASAGGSWIEAAQHPGRVNSGRRRPASATAVGVGQPRTPAQDLARSRTIVGSPHRDPGCRGAYHPAGVMRGGPAADRHSAMGTGTDDQEPAGRRTRASWPACDRAARPMRCPGPR